MPDHDPQKWEFPKDLLMPCPFCGSSAKFVHPKGRYEWFVQCTKMGNCYGQHLDLSQEGYTYKSDAANLWNRRAQ